MSAEREPTTPMRAQYNWDHKIHASLDSNPESNDVFLNFFDSRTIPNVRFQIFGVVTYNNTYKVIISKTPCILLNTTIQIMALNVERGYVNLPNWHQDDYEFEFDVPRDYEKPNVSFECRITWNGYVNSKPKGSCDNMGHFNTTPDFSDIVIKIDDREIPAHKIILANQSPVFYRMFKTNMSEINNGTIIVEDIEFDIMKKAIEFIYTGTIVGVLNVDILLLILIVADKYDIANLKIFCGQKLFENISNNNVMNILETASLCEVPHLIDAITYFMVENKSAIIQLRDFKDLFLKKPELFFDFIILTFAKFPNH